MSSDTTSPSTPPPIAAAPPNTPMPPPPWTPGSVSASAKANSASHTLPAPSTPGSQSRTKTALSSASPYYPPTKTTHALLPATPPRAANTPPHGGSRTPARTPGGGLLSCTIEPNQFNRVTVHTARCTICNRRNKDIMLRCGGCQWQICKPCRDKREGENRGLVHGSLVSPRGLSSSLSSGRVVRQKVVDLVKSGVPKAMRTPAAASTTEGGREEEHVAGGGAEEMSSIVKGKAKAVIKPASKKRAVGANKSKPVVVVMDHQSSDDDFVPDTTSPTHNKRRHTTLHITDTPTATSARPSRSAPHPSNYVDPGSPSSARSSASVVAVCPAQSKSLVGNRPSSNLDAAASQGQRIAVDSETNPFYGRIQELLEAQGVNTADNRYNEHFLSRYNPATTTRSIAVPQTVRHMAEKTPRMTAMSKLEARKRDMFHEAQRKEVEKQEHLATVRGVAQAHAIQLQSQVQGLSADEQEETLSAVNEAARKWAIGTYDQLPQGLQAIMVRGLDMRLDRIDYAYTRQLEHVVEQCTARKLDEYAQDRGGVMAASQ
ncbi:hypothetical protein ACEQ8H_004766 [Pleosporales sp. CAS-2024a]